MHAKTTKTNLSTYSNLSRHQNMFYVSQYDHVNIYCAQFYEQLLMVCSKNISIYDLGQMKKIRQINVKTITAAFIPYSNYVVYAEIKQGQYRNLVIYNYTNGTVMAKMTLNFVIQQIKTSRRAIVIASLQHLYALHYPTLKPIFEGFAGNGLKATFSVSRQGFTLAHTTIKKGQILVRNFTNIQTNKILVQMQATERKRSTNKYVRPTESVISEIRRGSTLQQQKDVKKQITIQAHLENVVIIRLSPNGYRVITSSIKGAIIRMYSCLSGELINQFRMSDSISPVVDIQFLSSGTQIVCLNQNNNINHFYTKMLDLQKLSETQRKGYEIYEQQNPTSFFSFLGFISSNFCNEYPFAYYKLDTKGIQYKQEKEKIEAQDKAVKINDNKNKTLVPEVKHERIQEDHQNENSPDTPRASKIDSQDISFRQEDDNSSKKEIVQKDKSFADQSVNEEELSSIHGSAFEQYKIAQIAQGVKEPTPQYQKHFLSVERKNSHSSSTRFKAMRATSVKYRTASIKSASKLGKKNSQLVAFGEKAKAMHFKGIINFGIMTNIKVFQSRYFFQLKYDPFNGGQMVQKSSISLLKDPLFSDL